MSYHMQWSDALENDVPYFLEKSDPEKDFFHPTAPEHKRRIGPYLKAGTHHLVFEVEAEADADNTNAFEVGLDHCWPKGCRGTNAPKITMSYVHYHYEIETDT